VQDKVAINSLSMVAEDHADSRGSARAIYSVIRQRLLSTGADNLLPLVYVIDSILKNVKGQYVDVIGSDAQTWLPTVYRKLPDPQRKQKLHKVYNTWVDLKLFSPDRLKAIGVCFEASPATSAAASQSSALAGGLKQVVAGITRAVRLHVAFLDASPSFVLARLTFDAISLSCSARGGVSVVEIYGRF
jgi:hypothetical protein